MSSEKKKIAVEEANSTQAEGASSYKRVDSQASGINPDVLREFGISAEEASQIKSRRELVRSIASKMVQLHGEVPDEDVLNSVEMMIETDPEIRDFIDSCFIRS